MRGFRLLRKQEFPENSSTNRITDVAGISVGHAHHEKLASGVTVALAESAAPTAATIFGGGPGTRELDAIDLIGSVGVADVIVLSGGSAFGLDAASGGQSFCAKRAGLFRRPVRIPIVPQATLFDLINGGDKVWGRRSPYHELGFQVRHLSEKTSRSARQERALAYSWRLARAG